MKCDSCKSRMIAGGAAMTKYICPHCFKNQISGSTHIPKLCRQCSEETNRCSECCKVVPKFISDNQCPSCKSWNTWSINYVGEHSSFSDITCNECSYKYRKTT